MGGLRASLSFRELLSALVGVPHNLPRPSTSLPPERLGSPPAWLPQPAWHFLLVLVQCGVGHSRMPGTPSAYLFVAPRWPLGEVHSLVSLPGAPSCEPCSPEHSPPSMLCSLLEPHCASLSSPDRPALLILPCVWISSAQNFPTPPAHRHAISALSLLPLQQRPRCPDTSASPSTPLCGLLACPAVSPGTLLLCSQRPDLVHFCVLCLWWDS